MSDDEVKFGVKYKQEKKIGKLVRKKRKEGRTDLDLKEILGDEKKRKDKAGKGKKAG